MPVAKYSPMFNRFRKAPQRLAPASGAGVSARCIALGATWLLVLGCGGPSPDTGDNGLVESRQLGLTLTLSAPSTYALASGAIPAGNTVSGGTGPYTCAIASNNSGGASCSVSGSVVSYTAGATAGYNIKSQRTSDYLRLVTASGGPYVETGGTLGSTAVLWKMAASGAGVTFQAKSTGLYLRNAGTLSAGNDLVADVAAASADVFTRQNCNGTGVPTRHDRFGFASAAGATPYWQATSTTIDAVNNGGGSACNPSNATDTEAFYFEPGTDTLTITDSASNTGSVTVAVEYPIAFMPASTGSYASTAINTVQTWGGSGIFTGGSSGCSVTTNSSGGGACTVTAYGAVSYTPGPTLGTDTLRVTDSQGHTGTFNVAVTTALSVSSSTSYAIASSALGTSLSVTGGSSPYSCSISTNNSGASSCSVTGGVVTYTAGLISGYNIKSQLTSDYLRLVSASGGPYVETGGAVGSSAQLWQMVASGSGYSFQSSSTGNYIRNAGTVSTGNDLVADVSAVGSAGVYTLQNCNGTGDSGKYNRFGFSSATGTSAYWAAKGSATFTVDAVNNGNAASCDPTSATPTGGFYLVPGTDVLTISDSASHTFNVTVSVEPPITFLPDSFALSTAASVSTQAMGGNGIFTGGSASCVVTANNTGGGSCTTTGWGTVSYTPGSTPGTDTITLTDSVGHTGTFTVSVGPANLTQVAMSHNYFGCGRASDGTARCWGYNSDGELGNGTLSAYSSTPVTVSGLSGVTAVTAGELHACALKSDHTVRCWGDNSYGQLGNGTLTASPKPVVVSGISDATAISAGMLHTCALRSGGTVVCWGENANGQVGNSSASNWPNATTPAAVTGLSSISSIAAGGFHSCSLSSGGAVSCWGDNSSYQLGNGAGGPAASSFSPVSVTGLSSGVSSIASGELHSCAVLSGSVKCWGDNTYGQLGNNTTTSASSPVAASNITTAVDLAAGYTFTCARDAGGNVSCWGRNTEGELADTTSTSSLLPQTWVLGLNTASSVSAGGLSACVVLKGGLTECWGYNAYGQLGNGTTSDAHQLNALSFGYVTPLSNNKVYYFSPSYALYKSASIAGGGDTLSTAAALWDYHGWSSQLWKASDQGSGNFTLIDIEDGLCLDRKSTGIVQQYTCNGGTNQLWSTQQVTGNLFKITNGATTQVMEVAGSQSTTDGAAIDTAAYDGSADMKWQVTENVGANLLINPGFESNVSGNVTAWTFSGASIAHNSPHTGSDFAALSTGSSMIVTQAVTVTNTGSYTLSAWVSTAGANGVLGLNVNGSARASVTIPNNTTYNQQTISNISLSAGDTVLVYVSGSSTNSVNLDDTSLTLGTPNMLSTVCAIADDSDAAITYSGTGGSDWSSCNGSVYYSMSCHTATTTGADFQFTFTGSQFSWYGLKDVNLGKADVYIDGTLKTTVDCYSATRGVYELYNIGAASGTGSTTLTAASHTVQIIVKGTKNASSTGTGIVNDYLQYRSPL
jgi:alpha-tubulin suppressor-like RCC1 family protein